MAGKVNRIIQEANRMRSGAWTEMQITGPTPSIDPTQPPMYVYTVAGRRGDGVVFKIPVTINKQRIDLAPPQEIVRAVGALLNQGIQQLMTFTGCLCTGDSECETHKTNVTVH